MAAIPAGSLMISGFGDAGTARYLSIAGADLGQPASAFVLGSGVGGLERLSGDDIAVVGAGGPSFPSTNAGAISGADITLSSEAATPTANVGGFCISVDGSNHYYTAVTKSHAGVFSLNVAQWDPTSDTAVATWTSIAYDNTLYLNNLWDIAVSPDGLTLYIWMTGNFAQADFGKHKVHIFDLNGAGSYVGKLDNTNYTERAPGTGGSLFCTSGGDIVAAFSSDGAIANDGVVRRYSSAGSVLHTYTFGAGSPKPEQMALDLAGTGFWVWVYDGGATFSGVTYYHLLLSDGSEVDSSFAPEDGTFEFDSPFTVLGLTVGGAVPPTTPTVSMVNSNPCCGDTVTPGTGTTAGPILPGTGWTPQCAGGGEVPTAVDLTDSQNWDTLIERAADVWFEMRLAKFPATDGTTVYRWSKRPFSDPGSWKDGRLISWSPITRAGSSIDGDPFVGGWSVVIEDSDGLIRTLLEQETNTEYFLNREAGAYLLSPAGRAASLEPRTLSRGWISNVQTMKGRLAKIDVSDIVGSQYSGFNLEKTIPSVLLDDIAVAGQLVDGLKGKVLPIYAGELSDNGAVDVNGNPAERGLVPAFDIGAIDITDPYNTNPPTSTAPTPPVITFSGVTGTTGQESRSYGATLITPYGESLMSNIVTCNGASIRNLSNFNEISGTFDGGPGDINKVRIWYGPTPDHMVGWLDEADYNGSGIFGYDDGAAHWPSPSRDEIDVLKTMDAPAAPPDNNPHIMAVCLGKSYDIKKYFGSNLADGVGPTRVEVAPGLHGSQIIGPNDPEWPFDDPWIVRNGITYTGYLSVGPLLVHHQQGIITQAVDICGPHDDTVSPRLLINQAFRQLLWLLNEHVAKNGGTGYRTGDYWPLEAYANGDSLFQTTKFEDAQTQSADWLGDGLGYLGMIALTEPISVREFVRRFCLTFGCRLTHNHHGQVFPFFVAPATDTTAGRALREHIEIDDIGEPLLAHDEIMNRVKYGYHFDPDATDFRNVGIIAEDTTSIAAHTPGGVVGGTDRRGVKQGADRDLVYTNDTATAEDVITRELARRARRPRYLPVTVDLLGLEQEISAQVRATHREGLGSGGDVLMASLVMEHTTDVDSQSVTLLLQDLRTMTTPPPDPFTYLIADVTSDPLFADDGSGALYEDT